MVTKALQKIFRWPTGYLLNEGYMVKCAGTPGMDEDGAPVITDRHLICTLDDHLPGTNAHAVGNEEFTDELWVIEPNQTSIDWTAPACQVCGKEIAP